MAFSAAQAGERQVPTPDLLGELRAAGIEAAMVAAIDDLRAVEDRTDVALALVDFATLSAAEARQCLERCSNLRLPAIALVPSNRLAELDTISGLDDFVVSPTRVEELAARARRLLGRSADPAGDDTVRSGDLVIKPASYEVSLRGRRVDLRFKEYELLLLMARSPGRVYSRKALLKRVWGYEYLGGTRTVDVHIRRLRSKIEDADHSFIETVWNVGYRFRDAAAAAEKR